MNIETACREQAIKFSSFTSGFWDCMSMCFMGITIKDKTGDDVHTIKIDYRLDTVGNEICGGKSCDHTVREYCGKDRVYNFGLKDVEVYQIV